MFETTMFFTRQFLRVSNFDYVKLMSRFFPSPVYARDGNFATVYFFPHFNAI